uniref:Uncharacterized protein n=1 Tax=Oryza barthii TaxID=65489 RepID=A0A0D3H133_9ORYZ
MADEHPIISSDSMFLKAILPTLNVSPCNPLTITGGAGSSTVAAAAFAGGSSSPAPLQVLVFQQQSTGNGNMAPADNSMISFNNITVAPVANAVISFNNFARSTAGQASATMGHHLSGGVQQLDAPQQKGPSPTKALCHLPCATTSTCFQRPCHCRLG